jgi:hypothetical protein
MVIFAEKDNHDDEIEWQKGGNTLGVFKKQGAINIDCDVKGYCMRGRIASDERLAETVLCQRSGR